MASDLSLICSWPLSSTVEVQALNKAGVLSFRQIRHHITSEIALKRIRGVIPLENLPEPEVSRVYKLLTPVIYSDNELVLSLFHESSDVVYPYKKIEFSVFLEDKQLYVKFEFSNFGAPLKMMVQSSMKDAPVFPLSEINDESPKVFSKELNLKMIQEIILNIQRCLGRSLEFSIMKERHTFKLSKEELTFYRIPKVVFVSGPFEETLLLGIDDRYKTENLKEKIFEKKRCLINEQVLIYGSKILQDGRNLSEYNIQHETTLHLNLPCKGGMSPFCLAPLSEVNEVIVPFNKPSVWRKTKNFCIKWFCCCKRFKPLPKNDEALPFTQDLCQGKILPGLNIKGICNNDQCNLSKKMFWKPKEMGIFWMRTVSVTCPSCEKKGSIKNIGFTQCYFSIEGYYVAQETNMLIERLDVKAPDNGLLIFEGEEINYISLKITTTKFLINSVPPFLKWL